MLRKIRIGVAWAVFALATLLVVDFTGALHAWLGWVAKVQLIPAILAVNVAALIVVGALTLLFGRIYCSTLCPLGIMQYGVSWLSGRRRGKKARFRHSRPMSWLRYGLLALAVVAMVAGIGAVVSLLDPWGTFGRIAQNIFSPLWRGANNLLAMAAERAGSYAFHSQEVYVRSGIALGVAAVWMVGLAAMAWWKGRIYCNAICPVGTLLGMVSRVSLFRLAVDGSKCTKCGLCEKKCKSGCIDSAAGTIDRSRCVVCFDCLESCNFGAVKYIPKGGMIVGVGVVDENEVPELKEGLEDLERGLNDLENEISAAVKKGMNRRNFFSVAALVAAATPAAVKAQQVERILLQVDGGLADIADKKRPERRTPITPPGSKNARSMKQHCTACQLCVSACPNNVLVPSSRLATLMQPEMTYERGYCRPECVECGEVCPAGAIEKITPADKTAISVGNAVWVEANCVVGRDNVPCTECERHCPTKAITLVPMNAQEAAREAAGRPRTPILKTPVVDTTLCIGCGACEHLCPARPFSAIYVEGNVSHHQL
ncbi:MAG: 4Fe-4S dicluster domain-containing protein [Alistipes sp.]|jgi:ferredoxin|nr:4Fe-4S dicluster domain-containing protein [Alistipes sp.]